MTAAVPVTVTVTVTTIVYDEVLVFSSLFFFMAMRARERVPSFRSVLLLLTLVGHLDWSRSKELPPAPPAPPPAPPAPPAPPLSFVLVGVSFLRVGVRISDSTMPLPSGGLFIQGCNRTSVRLIIPVR